MLKNLIKCELEIYILMILFGIWYLLNIGGAIKDDEAIFALQGYYFFQGKMPAEQFRPMGRYFLGMGQLLLGRTTIGAKFFTFFLGIISIYLTYKVAGTISNRVNGFFAALIVGIIPLYGDLSISALMDIILTFFVLLLFFFALRMLKTEDVVRKQRLIFFVGFLCICTFSTKEYGVFFSLVIFLLLLYTEWKTIKTITLFKRQNILPRLRNNLLLIPIFIVLGAGFGLLARAQLSDFWSDAGEKGRTDILDVLPGFLDEIAQNMQSTSTYFFFIVLGIVLFMILWVIYALIGRESVRTIKYLLKKRDLERKYHLLIYVLGAIIGFVVVYSPYIWNPVVLFTQIILNQTIHITHTTPVEIGGAVYDKSPWWSYFYWTWIYLGLMFVIGLLISLFYFKIRLIIKDKMENHLKFLFVYTFLPFILLSGLSLKNQNYFVVLFPVFTIFIVISITSIIKKIVQLSKNRFISDKIMILQVAALVLLMLIPGPLWMTLDDPQRGWDSGYDTAGDLVAEYVREHPNMDVQIIAFDKLSVEFYLPDDVLSDVRVIPLFGDNYSKDILGRPYIYYTDEELLELVREGDVQMLFDEPQRDQDRENLVRRYAQSNSTSDIWINDELVVYHFEG